MGGTARRRHGTVREEITAEFLPHVIEKYVDGMPGHDGQKVAYLVARNGPTRYLAVVLYEDRPGAFGFYTKIMDETQGPHYYDVPEDFLIGLSEPVGYAREYREKVIARSRAVRDIRAYKRDVARRDYGGAYDGLGTVFSDADSGL
jgi:hypothetical protein